jgi:glutamyl-tRNA reductase
MYLLAFALRQPHAPLAIREKFSITNQHIEKAYNSLNSIQNIYKSPEHTSSFILSTCNRSEIYVYLTDDNQEYVLNWWADFCNQSIKDLIKYVYIMYTVNFMFSKTMTDSVNKNNLFTIQTRKGD